MRNKWLYITIAIVLSVAMLAVGAYSYFTDYAVSELKAEGGVSLELIADEGILKTSQQGYVVKKNDIGWYRSGTKADVSAELKVGYSFEGWYNGSVLLSDALSFEYTVNGWSVLTAYAFPTVYDIIYDTNGGTLPPDADVDYTVEDPATLPTPSKPGYEFDGWYEDEDPFTDGPHTETPVDDPEDKTYHAKWEIINYSIKYVPNGGTMPSNPVTSWNVENPATLPVPTRPGYTFKGWYEDAAFTDGPYSTTPVSDPGNKTYYAKWEIINYDIIYDTNGGTLPPNADTSWNVEDPATLPIPTKPGYEFDGWYEDEDPFTDGPYTETPVNDPEDKTYHAKWNVIAYGITYNLNGGALPSGKSNPTSYTIEDTPFTLNNPTKTGYTFAGWTGSNGTTPQTSVTVTGGSTGEKSFTANWTANTNTAYKVQHWQQNVTGGDTHNGTNFTLKETDNLTGTTGAKVTPARKSYTGFTAPAGQEVTIAADGSTVVNYYYTRNSYTLSLGKGTGIASVTGAGSYRYGASVTIDATVSAGYTWSKWSGTHDTTTKAYTFTMPANNVTDTANATVNTYKITYNLNGGALPSGKSNPTSYTIEDTPFTLNNPTKTGYTFAGWTGSNGTTPQTSVTVTGGSTGEKTFTANWTANTNTAYKVQHWQQNITGGSDHTSANFTLKETDNLTGTTGAKVTPARKSYTGFTAPAGQEVTIAADGSTVVSYYYTRNSYTLTLNKGTGIASVTGAGSYRYGASVTINATVSTGYTWNKWTGDAASNAQKYTFTMPASNVTDTANATAITYAVKYNANGGSGTMTNSTHTYDTAKALTANSFTRTGYTFAGWATSANGTVVYADKASVANLANTQGAEVNLYAVWNPITYTVKYNANGGSGTMTSSTHTYGITKALTANSFTRTGYTFAGWATSANGTVVYADKASVANLANTQGAEVNLYAVWTANANIAYKVNHWQQNITGGSDHTSANFTLKETDNLTGTAGVKVTPARKSYTGFTAPAGQEVTIAADGSTVVNYYYTRNSYTLTLNKGTGIASVSGAGSYRYGASVTIDATVSAGYTWNKWTGTHDTTTKAYTFTMPANNVTDTANATLNTYTISYNLNGGAVATANPTSYNVTTATFKLNNPTKTGYTFAGWTGSNGTTPQTSVSVAQGSTGDKSFTANWTAGSGTAYKVNHWQQNITGSSDHTSANFTLKETDNLTGTTGAKVTPARKSYTGFTAPAGQEVTIAADGSTVVNYYYTRNSYTVTLIANAGISEISVRCAETGMEMSNSHTVGQPENVNFTVRYGSSMTIGAVVRNGYTWNKWTGTHDTATKAYTFTMPANNVTDTANATVNTYTITYYLNGGTVATANPTSYNVATATFKLNNPTKVGYTFAGWTGSNSTTPQTSVSVAQGSTGDKTFTANWTANTNTAYKVNHWQQNITGGSDHTSANFTLKETDNLTGTTGAKVTPARKSYTGFTAPAGQEVTIAADGSTVVNYYYTRNSYTLTLNKGTGIASVSGAGSYRYGASVTIDATASTGYHWVAWSGDVANNAQAHTFTMPAQNLSVTATGAINTYTVRYNSNGGSGTMADSAHTYGVAKALNANSFTKAGYFFDGWATSANGTVEYADKASVINLTETHGAVVTLYAQWRLPVAPVVTIMSPTGLTSDAPSTTNNGTYEIWGTATDADGDLKSVKVNGTEVSVAADGTWSLVLSTYPNEVYTISAVATDEAGHTASDTKYLTCKFKPFIVTKTNRPLVGYTGAAKQALAIPETFLSPANASDYGEENNTWYRVVGIASFAFEESQLKSVVIPDSVLTIGSSAFANSSSLTTVTLPSGLTQIADNLFFQCEALTTITIPDSVTRIGQSAFEWCTSLKTLILPDSLTVIEEWAFYACENLANVGGSLPEGVVTIEQFAFASCSSLTTLALNDNLTYIGAYAFDSCVVLNFGNLVLPEGLEYIGTHAFDYCNKLKTLSIPASVTFIGEGPAPNKRILTAITVDSANPNYCSVDGVLFTKDMKTLLQYPSAKTGSSYSIPEGVERIGEYAFARNAKFSTITIPGTVTEIGTYAFHDCDGIKTLTIPASVSTLEPGIARAASKHTSFVVDSANPNYCSVDGVIFTKDMTTLVEYPAAKSATKYIIPDTVTTIADYALADTYKTTAVVVPTSVNSIGFCAFEGAASSELASGQFALKQLYYCGTEDQWNSISFSSSWDSAGKFTITYNYASTASLSLMPDLELPEGVTAGEGQFIGAMPDVALLNEEAAANAPENSVLYGWLVDSGMAQQIILPEELEAALDSVYSEEPEWEMTLTPLYQAVEEEASEEAEATEPTESEEPTDGATEPSETEPEVTEDATEPVETEPEVTEEVKETEPVASEPVDSTDSSSEPAETQPEETQAATEPAEPTEGTTPAQEGETSDPAESVG